MIQHSTQKQIHSSETASNMFMGTGRMVVSLFKGSAGLLRAVGNPHRLRGAVSLAFGLLHGFGFAGILLELSLPASRLVPALFGFNLGVEIGQIAVVALVWPLLRLLGRLGRQASVRRTVIELGSAGVGAIGLFWLVQRTFG